MKVMTTEDIAEGRLKWANHLLKQLRQFHKRIEILEAIIGDLEEEVKQLHSLLIKERNNK